jgi:hypothetical protein
MCLKYPKEGWLSMIKLTKPRLIPLDIRPVQISTMH